MPFNLSLLSCPKCGGKLEKIEEGQYICSYCKREWEKEIDLSFDKIFDAVEAALVEQRAEDIARLKRALYEETHKEFISNSEVERICKDILNHYDDEDFYARFYLCTCESNKTALSTFCDRFDISSHINDIPDILDYLITSLREEWIFSVGHIIECAYKSSNTALYSKYRNKFEDMADKVQSAIYEPTLHRDVFVMYSGKDMEYVRRMVSVLENEYDLTCFVAARNLRHGAGSVDRYKEAIHTAIKNCDVYLLISSNNSRSRQCEVYEEILYIMDNFPAKPRVEYLAENYTGYGIEKKFKEFFMGLEYCTSYDDTAERVSDYCDKIQKGSPDVDSASHESIDSMLIKAKKALVLKKFDDARREYEKITELYSEDIRAYIGIVAAASENYTKNGTAEIIQNIEVINELFGKEAAIRSDMKYAAYIRGGSPMPPSSTQELDSNFYIEDGVLKKYIGYDENVTIPNGVTKIGEHAFQKCDNITSIVIPEGVTSIGKSAFSDCRALSDVVIPDGVTSIASSAFYQCKSLTRVTIPDSVKSIGIWAFDGCNSLMNITIPADCKISEGFLLASFPDDCEVTRKYDRRFE